MRNQLLTGFILHQKPYGESRSLIYFFSQQLGVVHGVGKKNLPLFVPIQLFATGKNALKTFSQSQLLDFSQSLTGQGLFAGMYLNEILLKLLPVEESMPELWQGYQDSINNIAHIFQAKTPDLTALKWQLRQFETLLLEQLGYGLDFLTDALGTPIQSEQNYRYQLQQGFVPLLPMDKAEIMLIGQQLSQWHTFLQDTNLFDKDFAKNASEINVLINTVSHVYRTILDNLLNYQTLQSRELWRELTKYQ